MLEYVSYFFFIIFCSNMYRLLHYVALLALCKLMATVSHKDARAAHCGVKALLCPQSNIHVHPKFRNAKSVCISKLSQPFLRPKKANQLVLSNHPNKRSQIFPRDSNSSQRITRDSKHFETTSHIMMVSQNRGPPSSHPFHSISRWDSMGFSTKNHRLLGYPG